DTGSGETLFATMTTPLSMSNVLLLDEMSVLRFQPNEGFDTTNSPQPFIRFHLWDQTAGVSGATEDLTMTGTGGTTPFSTADEIAIIDVLPPLKVFTHVLQFPRGQVFPERIDIREFPISGPAQHRMTITGVGGLWSSGPSVTSLGAVVDKWQSCSVISASDELARFMSAGTIQFGSIPDSTEEFTGQWILNNYLLLGDLNFGPFGATDDMVVATEDTPLDMSTLLNNDSNPFDPIIPDALCGGSPPPLLLADWDSMTANGGSVVSVNSTTLRYTPPQDFEGMDSFDYEIVNATDGTSASATVMITVNGVNDPPVFQSMPDTTPFFYGQPFVYNATATDVDSPTVELSLVNP
ncbi:MAG: hypothetical protein KC964_28780, partial [Candidatus Omnitrophica bacterium]|nr:hypothetical protein [Candidatus Omnitrophota bacterium]